MSQPAWLSVLQEDMLKAGPVPYSIVRATQFFEFMAAAVFWVSDGATVHVPSTLVQPMAAADVAAAVAEVGRTLVKTATACSRSSALPGSRPTLDSVTLAAAPFERE